jgi:hypothetical protein
MYKTRCPRCGAAFMVPPALRGRAMACPECGNRFHADTPAAGEVIDVEAEVIGAEPEVAEEPPPERGVVVESAAGRDETGRPFSRTIMWEVPGWFSGEGCCGCGCLMMILFVLLALRGCLTLF